MQGAESPEDSVFFDQKVHVSLTKEALGKEQKVGMCRGWGRVGGSSGNRTQLSGPTFFQLPRTNFSWSSVLTGSQACNCLPKLLSLGCYPRSLLLSCLLLKVTHPSHSSLGSPLLSALPQLCQTQSFPPPVLIYPLLTNPDLSGTALCPAVSRPPF